MQSKGILEKMGVTPSAPISYAIPLTDTLIPLNTYLGRHVTFTFTGREFCTQCGRLVKKRFQDAYCYPCFLEVQACGLCMIHPERCCIEKTGCDVTHWAHASCGVPHVVYLANSSGLKVGITRVSQQPTRWIDQGAIAALPFLWVPNRYQAGQLEVVFKAHVADKTNWRRLLLGDAVPVDLCGERDRLWALAHPALEACAALFKDTGWKRMMETPQSFVYPVLHYPERITSLKLMPDHAVGGILQGIKGQYLLWDTGVMNIRKYAGCEVILECA